MVKRMAQENNASMQKRNPHTSTIELTPAMIERGQREHGYSLILQAYRAGQISDEQWQKHADDEDFAEWMDRL